MVRALGCIKNLPTPTATAALINKLRSRRRRDGSTIILKRHTSPRNSEKLHSRIEKGSCSALQWRWTRSCLILSITVSVQQSCGIIFHHLFKVYRLLQQNIFVIFSLCTEYLVQGTLQWPQLSIHYITDEHFCRANERVSQKYCKELAILVAVALGDPVHSSFFLMQQHCFLFPPCFHFFHQLYVYICTISWIPCACVCVLPYEHKSDRIADRYNATAVLNATYSLLKRHSRPDTSNALIKIV